MEAWRSHRLGAIHLTLSDSLSSVRSEPRLLLNPCPRGLAGPGVWVLGVLGGVGVAMIQDPSSPSPGPRMLLSVCTYGFS